MDLGRSACKSVSEIDDNAVPGLDHTALDDAGSDVAEPANGVVPANAEYLLHPRTRMVFSGGLQDCGANPEALVFQREQIDALSNDVTAQVARQNL